MWNIRLYYETGFNAVNIPDSPALLETMTYADFPALDILQGEHLVSVNIKATRTQVKNADYMRLTDGTDTFYYIVNDFMMTSVDVATLDIALDYFTTHGGVTGLSFLDGIVERHHVAIADDVYGAYTEDDPMLVPSKELTFDKEDLFTDMTAGGEVDSVRILESTLDLYEMGLGTHATTYETETGEQVTVPDVVQISDEMNTRAILWLEGGTEESLGRSFLMPKTVLFNSDNNTIEEGVKSTRSLGVEDGILGSYVIPKAALLPIATVLEDDGHYSKIAGTHDFENTSLNFEYAQVKNKRVLYGNLNSFVLMSPANGNSVTFKPEDIAFDDNGHAMTSPTVVLNADPRPDGMPYYRFQYYKRDSSDFYLNALKGMEWANAPLVYSGKSGQWQADLQHNATTEVLGREQNMAQTGNFVNMVKNLFGLADNVAGTASEAYNTGYTPLWGGDDYARYKIDRNNIMGGPTGLTAGINIAGNIVNSAMSGSLAKQQTELKYREAYRDEAIGYLTGQIVAPEFRYARSNSLRDFRGNGCIVYRYRPQASDIQKLDKVLTMYGYKDTQTLPGHESYLTNRSKFNYIKATGVSVAGNKPKWLREGVAMQLSVGTRIWHVKPNTSVYTDGSNV